MKSIKNHWAKLIGALASLSLAMTIVCSISADEIPQPVMTIALTNTNQLYITITNGVSTANYELYRRPVFDLAYPFTLHIVGAQGQTNFLVDMGVETTGFLRAAIGSDWDQDSVTNAADGDPIDANVGYLSITIDSPANGSTFD